jgi:hypothetical protein
MLPRNRLESLLEEGPGGREAQGWVEGTGACYHVISLQTGTIGGLKELVAPDAIQEVAGELLVRWQQALTAEALRGQIELLSERISRLEEARPILIPLETLAPEGYRMLAPVHIVVRAEQEEYLASWFDANLVASGASPEEAFANLKDIVVAVYESLKDLPEEQMGPGPSRQIKVLRKFIAKE